MVFCCLKTLHGSSPCVRQRLLQVLLPPDITPSPALLPCGVPAIPICLAPDLCAIVCLWALTDFISSAGNTPHLSLHHTSPGRSLCMLHISAQYPRAWVCAFTECPTADSMAPESCPTRKGKDYVLLRAVTELCRLCTEHLHSLCEE